VLWAVLPALPSGAVSAARAAGRGAAALVFHFMNHAGTLAEHFAQLFADGLADSSLSERRTRMRGPSSPS